MTNEQILKSAIEKAKKNGLGKVHSLGAYFLKADGREVYPTLIFSHDFAKAFSEHIIKNHPKFVSCAINMFTHVSGEVLDGLDVYVARNHKDVLELVKRRLLTEMVLEEDPIKYLEQFL